MVIINNNSNQSNPSKKQNKTTNKPKKNIKKNNNEQTKKVNNIKKKSIIKLKIKPQTKPPKCKINFKINMLYSRKIPITELNFNCVCLFQVTR